MNTNDDEEALDIVQDAMFTLAQKYSSRPAEEYAPLFHTILYSKINDWHRKQKVRNRWRVFVNRSPDEQSNIEDTVPQSLFREPEQQMLELEDAEQMYALIKKLPQRQQQALILRAWEGYNVAETAKIMKCSEGSVKTHYSRAVHALRSSFDNNNSESANA